MSVWLWFTVLFANFAEAMAEGRGKAQAASLRKARRDIQAKKLERRDRSAGVSIVSAAGLRKGDVVLVEAGDFIPVDGEVVEGVASVDESADHRRERPGHPRERRRPQRGHRRHAGAVRLAHRAQSRPIPARRSSTA